MHYNEYLDRLIQKYKLKEVWTVPTHDDYIFVSAYKNDDFLIQFITNYNDLGIKCTIRADFPETLDRWSVALFEEDFQTDEEFNVIIEKIDEFIEYKDAIILSELETRKLIEEK